MIGIDFGTTKSAVAVMKAGKPTVVPDIQGHRILPSLVMVTPDERFLIGWDALNHPSRYESEHFTISSIKRLVGKAGTRSWGCFTAFPQEVTALILGRLKVQAEAYCGRSTSNAVIAVPAHFDINQRWATMQAAECAGLKVLRLVNEATAAVLAYNSRLQKREDFRVLVFDFGGGTLDVSIVEGFKGVYEVVTTRGDDQLGGDDFDQIIVDYIVEKLGKQVGASVELSPMHQLVLKEAATTAKIDLSSALVARVYLPGFLRTATRCYDLDESLDRSTFESLCSKLFERAETILRTAMSDAEVGRRWNRLTDVVLIGGSTRIPYIQQRVRKVTRMEPCRGLDPEVGVAEGACLQAGILEGSLKDLVLLDVMPRTYSIVMTGERVSPMLTRNSSVPTRNSKVFTTTENDQTEVTIQVVEGENQLARQNTFVGELHLRGLSPNRAGVPQIEVVFDVDGNNILKVSARDKETGRDVEAVMEAPSRLNPAQMEMLKRRVERELERFR